MVFAVLGLSKFVDEELYAVWRRSEKADTAQMAHLFAILVTEAVREVDGVVQQG